MNDACAPNAEASCTISCCMPWCRGVARVLVGEHARVDVEARQLLVERRHRFERVGERRRRAGQLALERAELAAARRRPCPSRLARRRRSDRCRRGSTCTCPESSTGRAPVRGRTTSIPSAPPTTSMRRGLLRVTRLRIVILSDRLSRGRPCTAGARRESPPSRPSAGSSRESQSACGRRPAPSRSACARTPPSRCRRRGT